MRKIFLLCLFCLTAVNLRAESLTALLFGDSKPKTTYIGQMADNGKDKTGTGMQLLSKGNIYIGDFLHSRHNGLGMMLIGENGEVKNCPGTMVYVGKWVDGKKEGKGICYGPNGDILYEGMFSNDKPLDTYPSSSPDMMRWFSTLELSNGELYLGELKNGNPDGFGLFVLNDGRFSISRVRNNNRFGTGLLLDGPDAWQLVKWENSNSFTTITSSADYANRKSVYNEVKSRQMAQFRSEMSEVVAGLMSVGAEFQKVRAEKQSVSASSASYSDDGSSASYTDSGSSGSASSGSGKPGSKAKEKTAKSNCGSAWLFDCSIYSDCETVLIPNGPRSAHDADDREAIKSRMRALRKKWEARGCHITKSPYED